MATALLQWLTRNLRRYLLNPEAIILSLFFVLLYYYFFHSATVWTLFDRLRVCVELKLSGQYDRIPTEGGLPSEEQRSKASWELRKDRVGAYAIQGRRPHMEDRFNVITDLEHTNTSIYGVFDGHGGEFAADFVEKTLFKRIMVRLLQAALAETAEQNPAVMLTEEILRVDEQLLQIEKSSGEFSGTTCLVAVHRANTLYVANVGDSRGVLCDHEGNAVPLSFDHKPHQLRERKRIRRAGGFISFSGVWRVAGVLATSRALGDLPLKQRHLVIAEPDVLTFDLAQLKPRFLLLASDGLWDAFSNEEAVRYVRERLHEPHFGARSLVLQAFYRGSLDNISVIVVCFDPCPTAAPPTP